MDERITKYIDVEERIKDIHLDETKLLAERRVLSREIARDWPKFDTPKEIDLGIEKFLFSPISAHTYKIIHKHFTHLPEERVFEKHIQIAKDYTSNLLGEGLLNNTEVIIVPEYQWGNLTAEAFCIANGLDNHHVFMPQFFSSPVELLCHELGHAAHHTGRRTIDDFWSMPVSTTSTEFVAHFCQNRFILDELTQTHFLAALGQLVTASFALSIMSYGKLRDFEGYINSEASEAIRNGWDIQMIRNQYDIFSKNISNFKYEVDRGIGLIMALSLIDEIEGMKKFLRLDRVNLRFDELLDQTFPGIDHLHNFNNINNKIIELLNRF